MRALEKIVGDMDDMESNRMFGGETQSANKGVDITISIVPQHSEPDGDEVLEMNKGGCADYSEGGVVEAEEVDMKMPPMFRKKKRGL